jgi:hypothetical protein
MLNFDDWQALKSRLSAHRRSCPDCRDSEKGCFPYQREFHWGKISYLKWIESGIEREHPEVERRRLELERARQDTSEHLAALDQAQIWDRAARAARKDLEEQLEEIHQRLVEHYRT